MLAEKTTSLAEQGAFSDILRKKKIQFIIFQRRVRQLQKNRTTLLGYTKRKLERIKLSKNFIWPPLLKIIKKNVFINTLTARGGLRGISCLYWMQWVILPPTIRLKFSMPSLLLFSSQTSHPQGIQPSKLEDTDGEQNKPLP